MKDGRFHAYPCTVNSCTKEGRVPLCSGELHLCGDHFDHWVAFLKANPLQVEKWSTDNFSAWTQHFSVFVRREVRHKSSCLGS